MKEIFGLFAACLTTFSFLPQAIKTIKDKDTTSISLAMYIMFVSGVFCWLIYGLFIEDLMLIMANSVTLVFSSIVLIIKIKNLLS